MDLKAKIECHCRLTSFSLSIPPSSLPLKSSICHCHSCRHTTGQLFTTWAVIPVPLPSGILESGNLAEYEISTCQRWSCKRCGASVINIDKGGEEEEWEVATGVLHFKDAKGLEGKLKRVQLWVEDVKGDGGAVGWINQGKLEGMDRHRRARGSEMVNDETVQELMARGKDVRDDSERLRVQCRCRNVSFEIAGPDKGFNGGTGKFAACLDACNSCRTVTGFEIACWAVVPKDLILVGQEMDPFLKDRSRLGHYKTSADTSRYFCVKCGAAVFYYRHGTDTIGIGIGLLEPRVEGAVRAETWFRWQKSAKALWSEKSSWSPELVWFQEDAVDAQFVRKLAEEMKLWEGS